MIVFVAGQIVERQIPATVAKTWQIYDWSNIQSLFSR
jgi:hypothetical protein